MSKRTLVVSLGIVLTLNGCAEMNAGQKQTAVGGGVGAATGAALGAIFGGGKGAAIGAGVGALAGAGGGYLWSRHMQDQKAAMETATQGTGVTVTQTPNNELKLEIPSDISFASGKADINPALRPVLDKFAQTLTANAVTRIRVVGHTDNSGTDAVNDPLSLQRASVVRDYLTVRNVAANRVGVEGHGSHEPLVDNGTSVGRAKNRRVEIFVAEAGTATMK